MISRSDCWMVATWAGLAALVLLGCGGPERAEQEAASRHLGQLLAEFNRGAALMEQYKYLEAAEAFERVVQGAPDWTAAQFNLGLAYLNLQQAKGAVKYLEKARETFESILARDPDHRHARFCLGMYYQHAGDMEKALECFQAVRQADPEDPYVAYKCAEVLISLDQQQEGTKLLEEIVAADPGFTSAVYRLGMQYRRLGENDKAMEQLARFRELNAVKLDKGHFKVTKVYGTAGKYYTALDADSLPLERETTAPAARILFVPDPRPVARPTQVWEGGGATVELPGVAVGDVDGDGDLDLCLTAVGPGGETAFWLNDGEGTFTAGPAVGAGGTSPCLGDVDNDGDLDLWLGRAGPDALWESDGQGGFTRVEIAGAEPGDGLTTCARLADMDSDGDLDLLSWKVASGAIPARSEAEPGANRVYSNNRDGSFEEVGGRLGLALPGTAVSAVICDDFDGDRDLDLVAFAAGGEAVGWVNYRAWRFDVRAADSVGLAAEDVLGATSGDPDKDGDRDLLVFSRDGLQLWVNQGGFRFQRDERFADQFGRLAATGGQFADMDNDGDLDIVLADAVRPEGKRGPALLVNDWPSSTFVDVTQLDPGNLLAAIQLPGRASCVAADFTGNGFVDIVLVPAGAQPILIENRTEGGHWIEVDLMGTRSRDQKSRSNQSAIGARVEVKTGSVFQQVAVGLPTGPVAMGPLRVHAGLGDHASVDWLRIIWPDAVLQAEVEVAANRVAQITEIQRKISSCPHLFAWDGERFDFVADFGGVGGLGYLVAPGQYAAPDPTEYLPIPRLAARDGYFWLQVTEPLEEVVYLDELRLMAVDHPRGTRVYPNEMMAVGVPPPEFEIFVTGETIEPVRVVDHRGRDVTDAVREVDRRYAGATDRDPRFTGYADPHLVELDFGDRLDSLRPADRLVLFAHGWVEYSYSSTNFAASQAGLRLQAPSVHVLRDGRWVEVAHEVGYPAGLRHWMTLDLTGRIRRGDRQVRITSNMELYWDRIFLAVPQDVPLGIQEAAPAHADLHFLGYPREFSPDGRHPNVYDYSNIDRAAAWKLMSGNYTRFGEVGPLVEEADDCFVIMGRGEELTLRFPADAFGPVPEGCVRSFLLKTDSYCKDMDLYTAYPDTVGPLPFHGMSGYPYRPDEAYPLTEKTREYLRTYNTRKVLAQ